MWKLGLCVIVAGIVLAEISARPVGTVGLVVLRANETLPRSLGYSRQFKQLASPVPSEAPAKLAPTASPPLNDCCCVASEEEPTKHLCCCIPEKSCCVNEKKAHLAEYCKHHNCYAAKVGVLVGLSVGIVIFITVCCVFGIRDDLKMERDREGTQQLEAARRERLDIELAIWQYCERARRPEPKDRGLMPEDLQKNPQEEAWQSVDCHICMHKVKDSRSWFELPCGHGVCCSCYRAIVTSQQSLCPFCRSPLGYPCPPVLGVRQGAAGRSCNDR